MNQQRQECGSEKLPECLNREAALLLIAEIGEEISHYTLSIVRCKEGQGLKRREGPIR
jgi:hypothetical protein